MVKLFTLENDKKLKKLVFLKWHKNIQILIKIYKEKIKKLLLYKYKMINHKNKF